MGETERLLYFRVVVVFHNLEHKNKNCFTKQSQKSLPAEEGRLLPVREMCKWSGKPAPKNLDDFFVFQMGVGGVIFDPKMYPQCIFEGKKPKFGRGVCLEKRNKFIRFLRAQASLMGVNV